MFENACWINHQDVQGSLKRGLEVERETSWRKFICHKLFHCDFLWECPVNTGFEKTNTAKSPVYYLLAHSYAHVEAITFIFWCFPCISLLTRSFLLFITSAFFIYVSIHFQWYWQGEFFYHKKLLRSGSFHFLSWSQCLIQGWSCKKELDVSHFKGLKRRLTASLMDTRHIH